jgi:hypothetical protein
MGLRGSAALPALVCWAIVIPRSASADVVSSFDSGSEGWTVVSFTDLQLDNYTVVGAYDVSFNASGGNPGGFISRMDPDNGDLTFSAPAKFLGNDSGATGLSYQMIYSSPVDRQTTDVMLVGGGIRLLYQTAPPFVPNSSWTTNSLTFTPSASWHVNTTGGALATAADFQTVLANLNGLYIRGEYTNGLVENPGLDNVRLLGVTAVPEPGPLVLALVLTIPALTPLLRPRRTGR